MILVLVVVLFLLGSRNFNQIKNTFKVECDFKPTTVRLHCRICVCVWERELQQRFKFLLKKHTLLHVNAAPWQVEISETEAQAAQREQDHSADVVFMVVEYSTVRLDDRGGGVYVAVRMGGRLWRRARPCRVFLSRGSSGYSRMLPQQRPDGDYSISKSTWRTSGLRCYRGTKLGEQQIRAFPGRLWHQTDIDLEEFTVLVPWVLSPGGPPRPRGCQWCSPRVSAWSSPAPLGSLPAECPAEREKKKNTKHFTLFLKIQTRNPDVCWQNRSQRYHTVCWTLNTEKQQIQIEAEYLTWQKQLIVLKKSLGTAWPSSLTNMKFADEVTKCVQDWTS